MRLLQCHIENFGGLHAVDMNFSEGLQTIVRENGWGKSTFAEFLVTMFYGFQTDRKRSVLENDRRRYAPWQQGRYGGSVIFETDGCRYRMERRFGYRDAKEDQTIIYDADTGKISGRFSDNPGEMLFAIDRESFEKTVYLAQKDTDISATPGIQAKIGNLTKDRMDIGRYADAQKMLKAESDRLTPHRKTGSVYRLREEKTRLEYSLAEYPSLTESAKQLEREIRSLEQEKLQMIAIRDDLQMKMKVSEESAACGNESMEQPIRNTSSSAAETEGTELQAGELAAINTLIDEWRERTELKREIHMMQENLHTMRKLLAAQDADADPAGSGMDYAGEAGNKGRFLWRVIGFLLLLVGGGFLLSDNTPAAVAAAAFGLVFLLAGMRRDRHRTAGDENAHNAKGRQRNSEESDRENAAFAEEAAQMQSQIRFDRRRIDEIETHMDQFLQNRNLSLEENQIIDRLYELRFELRGGSHGEEEKSRFRDRLQLVQDHAEKIRQCTEKIEIFTGRLAELTRQRDALLEQMSELDRKKSELANLEERLKQQEERFNIIEITRSYLEKARDSFTIKYRDRIQASFLQYYQMIAQDDREYIVDANLQIKALADGGIREVGFLSRGYRDLIGVCYRLALIDAMYSEEGPFLILDDPFVNLDDQKLELAMDFLDRISEKYQILYFTCQHGRA